MESSYIEKSRPKHLMRLSETKGWNVFINVISLI